MTTKRIRQTALQIAQQHIAAASHRGVAEALFDRCNSPSAFNRLHNMPRAVRKLTTQFSNGAKTRFRTGLITTKHICLALESLAKKMKRRAGQGFADFTHFICSVGAWAIRIAALVIPAIKDAKRPKIDSRQIDFEFETSFS